MKKLIVSLLLLFGVSFTAQTQTTIEGADGVNVEIDNLSRIITVGGSISETVWALGGGPQVIATDESTTFPPEVFRMPRVPYVRNLTSEGILSLGPTLILASDDASPQAAVDQIRSAGTDLLLIKEEESMEGVIHKIKIIGEVLGKTDEAQELIRENQELYDKAAEYRKELTSEPSVLFVLSVNNGSTFMAAGTNTGAEKIIALAGGKNAMESFQGYKPVSNEAILAANPDYILVMESRLEEVTNAVKNTDGINLITASQKNQIVGMDGNKLLGFGPRFGSAILELISLLHPEESDL
ncbi:MAG: hemin ABC transporter substrate-binding protein [Balneola sp.]|nr:MAG: hemin ABC transporter substrate-binding protein [Balneola sp.]